MSAPSTRNTRIGQIFKGVVVRIQDHSQGPRDIIRDLGRFVGVVLMMGSIALLAAISNAIVKGTR